MGSSLELVSGLAGDSDHHVANRLEHARTRLEERFLDGGGVLTHALQSVSDMIGALDNVTSSLDQDTVDTTVAELTGTADRILALPDLHAARHAKMLRLAEAAMAIQADVDEMLETLRYLRTFAVTVKITAGGAADFSNFADEMLERIEAGRKQVDGFADRLRRLREQVGAAISRGREVDAQYKRFAPDVMRNLAADAGRMGTYHAQMRRVTDQLGTLVRQVQGKAATILSALQIGDITRQRIEHVQAGLPLCMGDPAGGPLLTLQAAQTEDLLEEFQAGCATVTSNLGGLAASVKEVVALGRQARGDSGGQGFLRALEESVAGARNLAGQIEAAQQRAQQISRSSAATAHELIESIDTIRTIRAEIQYMAINTSLRCSRMGEAGKPMNVIASELRVFAEQMEAVSDRLVSGLSGVRESAVAMVDGDGEAPVSICTSLDTALEAIKQAGARMGADIKELSAKGDHLARNVGESVSRLDFTRELGDVLEECAVVLVHSAADGFDVDASPIDDATAAAQRQYATYTMAREREVHRRFFPAPAADDAAQPVAAPQDDLDDVFF